MGAGSPDTATDDVQLTIDGREEAVAAAVAPGAPFTAAQREILRLVAEKGHHFG